MFNKVTPESVGISSKYIAKFIKSCERKGLVSHSMLMMRGNDIFAEYYWAPFTQDKPHRMYSQTKSYVSIAIGLLESEGRLSLDDKIHTYFPEKIERELPKWLESLTIRDMLTMQTSGVTPYWFYDKDPDRIHLYFNENTAHLPSGMRWKYDSDGSQVLAVLVEKLTGMTLFDFLNERIFKTLGTFKNAKILKTKTEDSFGDSALLCTTRDMTSFARLLMNGGVWEGKRLISEEYVKAATARQVDNRISAFDDMLYPYGYGYQIWRTAYDGFAFVGMGNQITICIPSKDFIFCCTADEQGYASSRDLRISMLYDLIIENLSDEPLAEDKTAFEELENLGGSLKLAHMKGDTYSQYQEELSGIEYICEENPMGIKKFSFVFDSADEGRFCYTNEQGEKTMYFGIGKNVFGKFPQLGYSDSHTCVPAEDPDFMYDCAVSVAWAEDKKLLLRAQIIDDYLGNMFAVFSFKDDKSVVTMVKNAEAFLDEYNGELVASRV